MVQLSQTIGLMMRFPSDSPSLETLLRDAFDHLYDYPRLQGHSLTALVGDSSGAATGTTLHRLLLEALESLRPLARLPLDDPAWRPYLALQLRYVEAMEIDQVAAEIGISERQLRRESARAFKALAGVLWERVAAQSPLDTGLSAEPEPEQSTIEAGDSADGILARELARLAQAKGSVAASVPVETINGVVATLDDLLTRREIVLTLHVPDDLPSVQLDRVVFRQVLINVLTHVVELGTGGTVALNLCAGERTLDIAIQRQGFSPNVQPSQQEESDGARLHVAAQLLALHGGSLTESDVERRRIDETVLCLSLPSRPRPLLLVIDDNPELVQLYRRFLGDGTWRVMGAENGRVALEVAAQQQPDVILLDVMMPEQDGWEVLQRLKHLPATQTIPVVICSVLREAALAKSLGAADFIAKPVSQQALQQVLARCRGGEPGAASPDSL